LVALVSANRKPGIHIAWKTVTYRSVVLTVLAGAVLFSLGMHLAFPQFTDNSIKAADGLGIICWNWWRAPRDP